MSASTPPHRIASSPAADVGAGPAEGEMPVREAGRRLERSVDALLLRAARPEAPPGLVQTGRSVKKALAVIEAALARFGRDAVTLSYNGGKDCLVLVVLLVVALSRHRRRLHRQGRPGRAETGTDATHDSDDPDPDSDPDSDPAPDSNYSIPSVYVRSPNSFPEVDEFVARSAADYGLDVHSYDLPMKLAFADYLATHPHSKAILVGTRRTDPHGAALTHFDRTDHGWPDFVRVHPVVDWRYADIWNFILGLGIPYCALYDQGYTSLGGRLDTLPNPALLVSDAHPGSMPNGAGAAPKYQPAMCLVADEDERLGRISPSLNGRPEPGPEPRPGLVPFSVGLSGLTASGKTTVARYLVSILNFLSAISIPGQPLPPSLAPFADFFDSPIPPLRPATLIHQDDFYLEEEDIPPCPRTGHVNWDCVEAFDMVKMRVALKRLRTGQCSTPETALSERVLGSHNPPPQFQDLVRDRVPTSEEAAAKAWLRDALDALDSAGKTSDPLDALGPGLLSSLPGLSGAEPRNLPVVAAVLICCRLIPALSRYYRARLQSGSQQNGVPAPQTISTSSTSTPAPTTPSAPPPALHPVVVEGILLFPPEAGLGPLLDGKMLLQVPRATARARRADRMGRADEAPESAFWLDPPGFFDDVAWPEYVRAHEFLLDFAGPAGSSKGGDGATLPAVREELAQRHGISVIRDGNRSVAECCLWAAERICTALDRAVARLNTSEA